MWNNSPKGSNGGPIHESSFQQAMNGIIHKPIVDSCYASIQIVNNPIWISNIGMKKQSSYV